MLRAPSNQEPILLSRRHVLSLAASATIVPVRAFADVIPRYEVRKACSSISATTEQAVLSPLSALTISMSSPATIPVSGKQSFRLRLTRSNSVIALETGVVGDPDKDVFKWDGVTRSIPGWNKDHTLRTAIAVSAVPVYQEIARRIGAERMQKYVDAFEYGNRNIGGGIDRFWLTGDLRISPLEQIAFVDKLRRARCRCRNVRRI
jgi:beta-lactamase class D